MQRKGPVTAQGNARVSRNVDKPNSVLRQVAGLMAELKVMKAAEDAARRRRRLQGDLCRPTGRRFNRTNGKLGDRLI